MGTLVFVCPAMGAEVSTGIEMEPVTLQQLELSKVYCPHCRQQHQMAGIGRIFCWRVCLSSYSATDHFGPILFMRGGRFIHGGESGDHRNPLS